MRTNLTRVRDFLSTSVSFCNEFKALRLYAERLQLLDSLTLHLHAASLRSAACAAAEAAVQQQGSEARASRLAQRFHGSKHKNQDTGSIKPKEICLMLVRIIMVAQNVGGEQTPCRATAGTDRQRQRQQQRF